MKISLTFDNGPDLAVTPGVLDTLAKHEVKATFFLLGKNLAEPERRVLAVRAFSEGHRLGNHSYSHSVPFGLLDRPTDAVNEILATDALLGDLRGAERLFRPFGRGKIGKHLLNDPAWDALVENKFTCVQTCALQAWSVIVLHDLPTGAMRQLDRFLAMLADRGAEFSQDFPAECTPLRKGVPIGPNSDLISSGHSVS